MKAFILAGGMGTRLGEETDVRPEPMVEIGLMPILSHIRKGLGTHDVHDFIICLGSEGTSARSGGYGRSISAGQVTSRGMSPPGPTPTRPPT